MHRPLVFVSLRAVHTAGDVLTQTQTNTPQHCGLPSVNNIFTGDLYKQRPFTLFQSSLDQPASHRVATNYVKASNECSSTRLCTILTALFHKSLHSSLPSSTLHKYSHHSQYLHQPIYLIVIFLFSQFVSFLSFLLHSTFATKSECGQEKGNNAF